MQILAPLMLFTLLQVTSPATIPASSAKVHVCRFEPVGAEWKGSCGRPDDENPSVTVSAAKSVTTGKWRKDYEPSAVWAKLSFPTALVPIETAVDRMAMANERHGWFSCFDCFSARPMSSEVDFDEMLPIWIAKSLSVRGSIVRRVWNRDTRSSGDPAEITGDGSHSRGSGGFHHRRPALQVVRKIVEERSAGKPYKHRLMDYTIRRRDSPMCRRCSQKLYNV